MARQTKWIVGALAAALWVAPAMAGDKDRSASGSPPASSAQTQSGTTPEPGTSNPSASGVDSTRNNTDPGKAPSSTATSDSSRSSSSMGGSSSSMSGSMSGDRLSGRVQDVDASKNTLTLSDGKQLKIDSSSNIMKDGKTASLSDIKAGDDVRASFTPGSSDSVQSLTVTSSGSSSSTSGTGSGMK